MGCQHWANLILEFTIQKQACVLGKKYWDLVPRHQEAKQPSATTEGADAATKKDE